MKKLLFLGVGSALIFTMGGVGPAQADGGKHISSAQGANSPGVVIASAGAGKCASCHRAHTAKAEYLLKQAQPALCYTCHGAGVGSNTDVQDGIDSNTNQGLRGGGFEKAAIGSGLATKDMGALSGTRIATLNQKIPVLTTVVGGTVAAPVATTSKHNINGGAGDAGTAWGSGTDGATRGQSLTLECGSCHDPHGNGNYRILRPIPVDSGYAVHVIRPARAAVPDDPAKTGDQSIPPVAEVSSAAAGIKIPDATTKVYTTPNYWLAGDSTVPADATASYTGELTGALNGGGGTPPDGYIANIANWCTTCHTRYLATTQSFQTDSGDPTFMYKHRSDANYKAGAANCITCHVSHGSNASMAGDAAAVPNPDGTATAITGDSRLLRVDNRGTCVMCHNV